MKLTRWFSISLLVVALALGLSWSTDAQINATAGSSAGTAFGTAIATPVVVVASVQGSAQTGAVVSVHLDIVQTVLGVTCGAGSNTATPTLAWTGPGGTSKTLALTALTVSANGALDTLQADIQSIAVQMGSSVSFTMASSLASANCAPVPSYTIFWRVF
jgi:hypothetical protein